MRRNIMIHIGGMVKNRIKNKKYKKKMYKKAPKIKAFTEIPYLKINA